MDGKDCLYCGALHGLCQGLWVHIKGTRLNLDEDRFSPTESDDVGSSWPGVGCNGHAIAWTDLYCHQREQQGRGAVTHRHGVLGANIVGHCLLEGSHSRSLNKETGRERLAHRLEIIFFNGWY